MKPLTFGMDFDDTFTACPELWAMFIKSAKELGHRVFIVTCRRDSEDEREEIKMFMSLHGVSTPIIFANMGSKLFACEQRGIKIDQWIEDEPRTILYGR